MEARIKSFENFLAEYDNFESPGSVEVPGEWYKDNVNSRNYRPAYTQMPQVVDAMYQSNDVYNYLDTLSEEEEFGKILKDHKNPKDVTNYVKKRIHEELAANAKSGS